MPVSISIDMLAAFVTVAQRRSVSAAAADLGVSKSVVSKRVGQLETAVQATLFARSTRRVALTSAGEAYLEHARRARAELAGAGQRVRVLPAWTPRPRFGAGILAVAAPERMRLQRNRALLAFLRQPPAA